MKCHHLIPALMCAFLVSCSSTGGNKGLFGAAAGALIGSLVGDNLLNNDDSSNNAGGAGGAGGGAGGNNNGNGGFLEDNAGLITGGIAGYAAGAISDSMAKEEVRQKYLDGYNKGRSDAIKELYWVKRDAERPSGDATIQRRYYEVPVPEHITTDGVLVGPHKAVVEVVE
ncbi:MAG TPA: hypothetical protein VD994_01060 [Prosthecobacter sp.]|nr:hypothetical protein [Prosthecobacter sp.]